MIATLLCIYAIPAQVDALPAMSDEALAALVAKRVTVVESRLVKAKDEFRALGESEERFEKVLTLMKTLEQYNREDSWLAIGSGGFVMPELMAFQSNARTQISTPLFDLVRRNPVLGRTMPRFLSHKLKDRDLAYFTWMTLPDTPHSKQLIEYLLRNSPETELGVRANCQRLLEKWDDFVVKLER